ncbi:hypothetical protein BFG60_1558 [Microcystis aeruginosa NIES-98]|nr:hypothetical protein BFG60_1558 [Microcystis aeruginosa NIES-98]
MEKFSIRSVLSLNIFTLYSLEKLIEWKIALVALSTLVAFVSLLAREIN